MKKVLIFAFALVSLVAPALYAADEPVPAPALAPSVSPACGVAQGPLGQNSQDQVSFPWQTDNPVPMISSCCTEQMALCAANCAGYCGSTFSCDNFPPPCQAECRCIYCS